MNRHLLPNEIDLLVDGEVGFGVAPLHAHVRDCAACRTELTNARNLAAMLEELPRFAPSYGLADRVMAQVPVFVPWHVAVRDTLRGLIPESRPLRVVALAGGGTFAAIFTLAFGWLFTQGELLTLAGAAAGDGLRAAFTAGVRELGGAVFGEQAVAALAQGGASALAIAGGGFVVATGVALLGLRRAASVAARQEP